MGGELVFVAELSLVSVVAGAVVLDALCLFSACLVRLRLASARLPLLAFRLRPLGVNKCW